MAVSQGPSRKFNFIHLLQDHFVNNRNYSVKALQRAKQDERNLDIQLVFDPHAFFILFVYTSFLFKQPVCLGSRPQFR